VIFDLSDHPLLGPKAKALLRDEDAFVEQVALAAELYGVSDLTFEGDKLNSVRRWLVLQLNHQLTVLQDHGSVWFAKQVASSQSRQSITYRDGDPLIFQPGFAAVQAIADEDGEGWENCRSVGSRDRGRN
jgi:hypothetical protein